jgi:glycosyltransferase involved in cell wall biosynthesis
MSEIRTPTQPPQIKPLAADISRTKWSVMIPAYNCFAFLKTTLESVLVQAMDIDTMQIAVVDDCSTDGDIKALVGNLGKGRVEFYRQEKNIGSLRNFESCINKARGEYIHILHGDDVVKPGFYAALEYLFEAHPAAGAAFTGLSAIDDKGLIIEDNSLIQANAGLIGNWLYTIAQKQRLQVCAIAVKRTVYEALGSFYGVHYGEDWEMWARIAAHYPVAYTPENFALYRRHENNISYSYLSTGQNILDIKTVIELIQKHLPANQKKKLKKIAKRNFAIYFTGNAQGLFKLNEDSKVAVKQAEAALRLDFNSHTVISLLKLYIKTLIRFLK